MEIKDHLLTGNNTKYVQTPNRSGAFQPGKLDTIIIHYTAGPSPMSAINTLTNPAVKASAHIVLGRDNIITQLVPFNIVAWHAGPSSWNGRTGFNQYSIGIEIDNAGPLTKSGDTYRAWFGGTYKQEDVIEATFRYGTKPQYWHAYTQEQIELTTELCSKLISTYNIKYILGHEEISRAIGKTDPGPAFPLDRMRDQLLGAARDNDDDDATQPIGNMRVSASKLNIRATPSVNGAKVALPLESGTVVKVLKEANGWYKVSTEVEGWVFGQFLEKTN